MKYIITDECAFCLESINDYDYATLNCGHTYHYTCIQEWINTTQKLTKLCPQCDITGEILNIQVGKKSEKELIKEQQYNFLENNSFEKKQLQTQENIIEENLIEENINQFNTSHTPNNSQIQNQSNQQESNHSQNNNTEEDNINYICCNIL